MTGYPGEDAGEALTAVSGALIEACQYHRDHRWVNDDVICGKCGKHVGQCCTACSGFGYGDLHVGHLISVCGTCGGWGMAQVGL